MKLVTVNREIAKQVNPFWTLVKGDGYFYFVGPGTEDLESASVYVPRLSDLSLERWVEEARIKYSEYLDRMVEDYNDKFNIKFSKAD